MSEQTNHSEKFELREVYVVETKFDISSRLGKLLDNLLIEEAQAQSTWDVHSTKKVALDLQTYANNRYHQAIGQAEDHLDAVSARPVVIAPRLDVMPISKEVSPHGVAMSRLFLTPRNPAYFDEIVGTLDQLPTLSNRSARSDLHHRAYVDVNTSEIKTGEAWLEAREKFIEEIQLTKAIGLYALQAVGLTGRVWPMKVERYQLSAHETADVAEIRPSDIS